MSPHQLRTAVAAIPLLALVAACGPSDAPTSQPTSIGETGNPQGSPSSGSTSSPVPPTTGPASTSGPAQEDELRVQITIGGERFQATLEDSAASRDLVAQLPVTVEMADHGSVEKTGPLPSPLSLEGQPPGADPDVGDIGYYAPGNDLVLYYGDQSYYRGIVVLGRMDRDAAERLANMDGSITATVGTLDG
jgi:hypothetical protein